VAAHPDWLESMRTLLEGAAPAVLIVTGADGGPLASPVWVRYHDGWFEVVITDADIKARRLAANPRCTLLVFESEPPFRGIQVRGDAELGRDGVGEARLDIARRYLGPQVADSFVGRRTPDAVVARLPASAARVWDLTGMLRD
jgi:hypothetical protein